MHPPKTPPPIGLGDPWGPIGLVFFACYASIIILRYSRNVELSNYWWGVPMCGTPLGGPPRGPLGSPRGPRVSQSSGKNCKNSQKLYKNCSCIKMPQFITLTSILGHLGSWWGPWGVKIKILQWPGVILEIGHRSFSIFALFLYVEHHCDTGILNFWLWSFIVPPY